MSEIKIKTCPFCGVSLEHVPPSKVFYHENNGCILSYRDFRIDDIEKWNQRKPMERILTRLEKERHPEICGGWETMRIDKAIEIVKEEGGIE